MLRSIYDPILTHAGKHKQCGIVIRSSVLRLMAVFNPVSAILSDLIESASDGRDMPLVMEILADVIDRDRMATGSFSDIHNVYWCVGDEYLEDLLFDFAVNGSHYIPRQYRGYCISSAWVGRVECHALFPSAA